MEQLAQNFKHVKSKMLGVLLPWCRAECPQNVQMNQLLPMKECFLPLNVQKSLGNMTRIESILFLKLD